MQVKFLSNYVFILIFINTVTGNFRILAPEFICPKDDDSPIDKPDNIVITIQVQAGLDLDFSWAVRWKHLQVISQRFTLLLWKTIRELEDKLNGPQPEPYVYVIEHNELLRGVEYIFNVTSSSDDLEPSTKVFQIDNSQGDQILENVDGRGDMFSIMLIGGQETYTDLGYSLEAQVTTCTHTQDYYFIWTVKDVSTSKVVDVSYVSGYKLDVPPYSLSSDTMYDVSCQLIRKTTAELATKTGIQNRTLLLGLKINLNIDVLIISINYPFLLESIVFNHDYYEENVSFEWVCMYKGELCNNFENENNGSLYVYGLPEIGEYEITVTAHVMDQYANASARIITVEPTLPVIQVEAISRLINSGDTIALSANISNIVPTCTMTWYFATEEEILNGSICSYNQLENCTHGTPLGESITIFSLEENFLNELTDFSNDTQYREMSAETPAQVGCARVVAECDCSRSFDCDSKGVVYGELGFQVNDGPVVNDLKVTPGAGVALETVFRISTVAAEDPEGPLRYTFYCTINQDLRIKIASFFEHLAVETTLPYIIEGTELWLEVCDSLGGCSKTPSTVMKLSAGDARDVDVLVVDVRAQAARCEYEEMKKLAVFGLISYINTSQVENISTLSKAVTEALSTLQTCRNGETMRMELTETLAQLGIDANVAI